jgi:hypothetical protein
VRADFVLFDVTLDWWAVPDVAGRSATRILTAKQANESTPRERGK